MLRAGSPVPRIHAAECVGVAACRFQQRPGRPQALAWDGHLEPFRPNAGHRESVELAIVRSERDVYDIHVAALLLSSEEEDAALAAVRLLEGVVAEEDGPLVEPARVALARAAWSPLEEVRRRAFQVLVPVERDSRFPRTLRLFFKSFDRAGQRCVFLDGYGRGKFFQQRLARFQGLFPFPIPPLGIELVQQSPRFDTQVGKITRIEPDTYHLMPLLA